MEVVKESTTPVDETEQMARDLEDARDDVEYLSDEEIGIPVDYEVESLAGLCVEQMRLVAGLRYSIRANKAVHNDAEADRLSKQELAARNTLAQVKREHPQALATARIIASLEAEQMRRQRKDVARVWGQGR
jgi:hypothetical protein